MDTGTEKGAADIPTQRDRDPADIEKRSAREASSIDAKHLASFGAVGLALFALLKTYAAAEFSLTTAAALITAAPVNVLLDSIVSYSYEFFPLLALAAIAWAWADFRRTRAWGIANWIAVVIALLALIVSPVRELLISAAPLAFLVALSCGGTWLEKRWTRRGALVALVLRALAVTRKWVALYFLLAVAFVIFHTLTDVWLPAEAVVYQQGTDCNVTIGNSVRESDNKRLTIAEASGCKMVVGHVLNDDGNWISLVRADDRGLMRIQSSSVRYRELCHVSGAQPNGQRPLLWVFEGRQYKSSNTSCTILVGNIYGADLDPGSLPTS